MDILQLHHYVHWMNLMNIMWFLIEMKMAGTCGAEVGNGTWEAYCSWDAGNIYMMVYEVVILTCSFPNDLLTCALQICAFFCTKCQYKGLSNSFQISPMSI